MLTNRENIVFLVGGFLFFAVGVYFLKDISYDIFLLKKNEKKTFNLLVVSEKLKVIDKTLSLRIRHPDFEYRDDFENPFNLWEERKSENEKKLVNDKIEREKILLKGILIKEKPLAILEDSKGNTHILAAGENIGEQEVISITERMVVLQDKKGKYELKVEEP